MQIPLVARFNLSVFKGYESVYTVFQKCQKIKSILRNLVITKKKKNPEKTVIPWL